MPALAPEVLLPLRASFGPLSGALALTYLGVWVGVARDDRLIHRTSTVGAVGLVLAAVVLAGLALGTDLQATELIAAAAVVNAISCVVCRRGSGEMLHIGRWPGPWMVVACICLAAWSAGCIQRACKRPGRGCGGDAFCTIGYFLIVMR